MKHQDLADVLRGHSKAEEAIYWFAYSWHAGLGSDLYKVLCESSYIPTIGRKWRDDPDIIHCFERLDAVFQPLQEHPYLPVRIEDVREGHVLIAGVNFPCLPPKWPCKVYPWHGSLGVACSGAVHGVTLLPGSETTFHPFRIDNDGFIIGFRR